MEANGQAGGPYHDRAGRTRTGGYARPGMPQ